MHFDSIFRCGWIDKVFNMKIISFCIFMTIFCVVHISAWDYILERIENMNETDTSHVHYVLHIQQINRTNYSIRGNLTYHVPFTQNPERYHQSFNFYYSQLGNNQFEKLPYRVPRTNYCDYLNKDYRKYFMESMRSPASDLPVADDPNVDLCERIRSDHELTFRINNFVIDKSKLPEHIPSGVFIIEMIVDLDGVTVAKTSIIVRVQAAPEDE